jgi:RNA-dependent RNA polymerase
MKTGVTIGGRVFDFLAYSQSSLKDYTVWFVTPFVHEGNTMTADTIRMSLGDFR